jgi:TatD DNase family protein
MTQQKTALFDSHAHLTFEQFSEEERKEVLQRALSAGITSIMNIATTLPQLEAGWELQKISGDVSLYCAASTTPHDTTGIDDPFFAIVGDAARTGRIAAIGETGLDFFHRTEYKAEQRTVFVRYAQLAQETSLPLIVHCREAFPELFDILRDFGTSVRGVLHCFTGTKDEAKVLLDLGWYISLSGIVTFPKSEPLREVARFLPLDRLLIETDSPFLAPQPQRGHRNEPAFMRYTAEAVAALKGTSFEEIATITSRNAKELFH